MKSKCIILLVAVHSLFAATPSWTPEECGRVAQALCSAESFPPKHLVDGSKRKVAITFPPEVILRSGNHVQEALNRQIVLDHLLKAMPVGFDTSCFYRSSCNISTAVAYLICILDNEALVRSALASRDPKNMPFAFFRALYSVDGPEQTLRTMESFLRWHAQVVQPYACLLKEYIIAIAYKSMGYSAFQLGKPQDALNYYRQALKFNRTAETLFNMSSCCALLQDKTNAELYAKQAERLGFSLEAAMHHVSAVSADKLAAYKAVYADCSEVQVLTLDKVRGTYNLTKTNPLTPKDKLFDVGCMYVERASDSAEIQGVLVELISYLQVMEINIESVKCFNQKVLVKGLGFPEIQELKRMFLKRIKDLQRAGNYAGALDICGNFSNFPETKGIMEEILYSYRLKIGRPALVITVDGNSEITSVSGGANFNPTDANRDFLRRLRAIGVDMQSELYQNALAQVEGNHAKRTRQDVAERVEGCAVQQHGVAERPVVRSRGHLHRVSAAGAGAAAAAAESACDSDNDAAATRSLTFDSRLALIEAERLAKAGGYILPEERVFELSKGAASGGGSGTLQTLYEFIEGDKIELAHFRPHTHYDFDEEKSKAILYQFHLLQKAFRDA